MVFQRSKAARRHWVIHSGSPFLALMARTTDSSKPGGKVSDSMSVTNPAA